MPLATMDKGKGTSPHQSMRSGTGHRVIPAYTEEPLYKQQHVEFQRIARCRVFAQSARPPVQGEFGIMAAHLAEI